MGRFYLEVWSYLHLISVRCLSLGVLLLTWGIYFINFKNLKLNLKFFKLVFGNLKYMERKDVFLNRNTTLHPAMIFIWDHLNIGVTVTDENARIIYMNEVQKKLDGFERIKVLNKRMRDLYYVKGDRSITQDCLETRKPIINRLWPYHTRANKLNQALHTLFPLYDDHGNLNGTLTFITEYNQINEILNQLQIPLKAGGKEKEKLTIFSKIIGNDLQFNNILERAKRASYSDVSVMICGESGTGKELIAQAIHMEGKGDRKSFVPINCAAIPEHLLESLLFGTVKGAFTGATDKVGLFEAARGGTILLDEVNSMPLGLQAKLLRVLQEKKIRKIGSLEEKSFNAKIISTMNVSPIQALEKKQIRLDLFYRLAMVIVEVPPLRKRKLDIPLLCELFLSRNKKLFRSRKLRLASDVYTQFFDYEWPGNVRELEHVIYSALHNLGNYNVIEKRHLNAYFHDSFAKVEKKDKSAGLSATDLIQYIENFQKGNGLVPERGAGDRPNARFSRGDLQEWAQDVQSAVSGRKSINLKTRVQAFEKMVIQEAIKQSENNFSKAGKQLGLSPSAIHYKMIRLGIKPTPVDPNDNGG